MSKVYSRLEKVRSKDGNCMQACGEEKYLGFLKDSLMYQIVPLLWHS